MEEGDCSRKQSDEMLGGRKYASKILENKKKWAEGQN